MERAVRQWTHLPASLGGRGREIESLCLSERERGERHERQERQERRWRGLEQRRKTTGGEEGGNERESEEKSMSALREEKKGAEARRQGHSSDWVERCSYKKISPGLISFSVKTKAFLYTSLKTRKNLLTSQTYWKIGYFIAYRNTRCKMALQRHLWNEKKWSSSLHIDILHTNEIWYTSWHPNPNQHTKKSLGPIF